MATKNVWKSSQIGCSCHSAEPSPVVGFKLFGVEIGAPAGNVGESGLAKVQSHGNFTGCSNGNSNARKRAKGKPWTVEEHFLFLEGLRRHGKGRWKAISEEFVRTKTSTQVASHAQKFFIRMAKAEKKRCSVFDIPTDEMIEMVSGLNSSGSS